MPCGPIQTAPGRDQPLAPPKGTAWGMSLPPRAASGAISVFPGSRPALTAVCPGRPAVACVRDGTPCSGPEDTDDHRQSCGGPGAGGGRRGVGVGGHCLPLKCPPGESCGSCGASCWWCLTLREGSQSLEISLGDPALGCSAGFYSKELTYFKSWPGGVWPGMKSMEKSRRLD